MVAINVEAARARLSERERVGRRWAALITLGLGAALVLWIVAQAFHGKAALAHDDAKVAAEVKADSGAEASANQSAFSPISDPSAKGYPVTARAFMDRLHLNWGGHAAAKWGPWDYELSSLGIPPSVDATFGPGETVGAFEIHGRLTEVDLELDLNKAAATDINGAIPERAIIDAVSPGLSPYDMDRAISFLQVAEINHTDADVSVPGSDIGVQAGPMLYELWARPTGHRLSLGLEAHNRSMPGDAKPSVHHLVIKPTA